jgi:hypothetical protein
MGRLWIWLGTHCILEDTLTLLVYIFCALRFTVSLTKNVTLPTLPETQAHPRNGQVQWIG